jgi:hypothetical protein
MNAVEARMMENMENDYTGRNICILSDSQTAITALDSFHVEFQISLGRPSIYGETGRALQDPAGMGPKTHENRWK